MMMFKTFLKTALISSLLAGASLAQAGWFAQASESYLVQARHTGGGVYQCLYKTNPGNRGWRNFTVNFQVVVHALFTLMRRMVKSLCPTK
jgi:hypothetical protein